MGCRWISAPPWTSMGCRGQPASPWSSPRAAGESLLWHLEHLLPLLLHWPWCLQSCFSHIISLLSPAEVAVVQGFFPFLNMLSQRRYHRRWWAQPWPAVGSSWSQLALALSDIGEASSSFSQPRKPNTWVSSEYLEEYHSQTLHCRYPFTDTALNHIAHLFIDLLFTELQFRVILSSH